MRQEARRKKIHQALGFSIEQRESTSIATNHTKETTMTTITNTPTQCAHFARKPANVDELKADLQYSIHAPAEPFHIEKAVTLTSAEYDEFAANLMEPRPWLATHGGMINRVVRKVVAVMAAGRETLFVDPSGTDYGRYVGISA